MVSDVGYTVSGPAGLFSISVSVPAVVDDRLAVIAAVSLLVVWLKVELLPLKIPSIAVVVMRVGGTTLP
jgi:hypothetical protein